MKTPARQLFLRAGSLGLLALAIGVGCRSHRGTSAAQRPSEPTSHPSTGQHVPHADDVAPGPNAPIIVVPSPDPSDPRVQTITQGLNAVSEGQYGQAITLFRNGLADHPNDPLLLKGLATAYREAGHHDLALNTCRQLLEIDPNDTTALYNAAVAMIRLRRFAEAEEPLRSLLQIDPNRSEALMNLAVCLQAEGKFPEARDAWQVALDAEETAVGHAQLGEVLMDMDRPTDALEHFKRAAAMDPGNYDVQMNLAAAARAIGSYGYAVMALKQAAVLKPDDAAAPALLGESFLAIYQINPARNAPALAEAVKAWESSLAINSNQPAIRQHLETYKPRLGGP